MGKKQRGKKNSTIDSRHKIHKQNKKEMPNRRIRSNPRAIQHSKIMKTIVKRNSLQSQINNMIESQKMGNINFFKVKMNQPFQKLMEQNQDLINKHNYVKKRINTQRQFFYLILKLHKDEQVWVKIHRILDEYILQIQQTRQPNVAKHLKIKEHTKKIKIYLDKIDTTPSNIPVDKETFEVCFIHETKINHQYRTYKLNLAKQKSLKSKQQASSIQAF